MRCSIRREPWIASATDLRRLAYHFASHGIFDNEACGPWPRELVGAKPPLRPGHVWSIRTKLQIEGKKRDLALFNLAVDSKLGGCDVVAVRLDDVAPSDYSMDRATTRQKKSGGPVRFELTDQTRQAIDNYLRMTGRKPGQFLFAGRGNKGGLTTRQYARLVQEWVASIGLDPANFGTHSLRRTKAVLIYRRRCDRDRGENRYLIADAIPLTADTVGGASCVADCSAVDGGYWEWPCKNGAQTCQ